MLSLDYDPYKEPIHCCANFVVPVRDDSTFDIASMQLEITHLHNKVLSNSLFVPYNFIPGNYFVSAEKVVKFTVEGSTFMESVDFFFCNGHPVTFVGGDIGLNRKWSKMIKAKAKLRKELKDYLGLRRRIRAN